MDLKLTFFYKTHSKDTTDWEPPGPAQMAHNGNSTYPFIHAVILSGVGSDLDDRFTIWRGFEPSTLSSQVLIPLSCTTLHAFFAHLSAIHPNSPSVYGSLLLHLRAFFPLTFVSREDPQRIWERRSPLTPNAVSYLVSQKNIDVQIEHCDRRVFPDHEYQKVCHSFSRRSTCRHRLVRWHTPSKHPPFKGGVACCSPHPTRSSCLAFQ